MVFSEALSVRPFSFGLVFFDSEIVYGDHVAMSHDHKQGKANDIGVQAEVVSDAHVDHIIPLCKSLFLTTRADADSIPPAMFHLSDEELNILGIGASAHFVSILYHLVVKVVEVCANVYDLNLGIVKLVHHHKVRVDLNSAIFSQCDADIKYFLSLRIDLDDRAVLEQWRHLKLRVVHHESKLYQLYLILAINCVHINS